MKKILPWPLLLLTLAMLVTVPTRTTAQAWQWANAGYFPGPFALAPSGATYLVARENERDTAYAIQRVAPDGRPAGTLLAASNDGANLNMPLATDTAGNVYAFFSGTHFRTHNRVGADTTFGATPSQYLGKWDAAGRLCWLQRFTGNGGIGHPYIVGGEQLGVDAAQRVTLSGEVAGGMNYNDTVWVANSTFVAPPGQAATFVLQLDAAGHQRWSYQTLIAGFLKMAVAPGGSVHLLGWSPAPFTIGGTTVPVTTAESAFWLRLDANGIVQTSHPFAEDHLILGANMENLAVDAADNAYLLVYGERFTWQGTVSTAPSGQNSSFIAKISAAGTLAWVRRADPLNSIQGQVVAYAKTLCVTPDATVLVGGRGSVASGLLSLPFPNAANGGSYVLALDAATGQPQWLVPAAGSTAGANGDETVGQIAVTAAGDVRVGGSFYEGQPYSHHSNSFVGSCYLLLPPNRQGFFLARLLTHYNQVPGTVFTDANSDRQQNAGEAGHADVLVELQPDQYVYTTDSLGSYNAITQLGSYSLSIPNPPLYYNAVVAAPRPTAPTATASFSTYGNTAPAASFALQPVGPRQDLQVFCTAIGYAVPGHAVDFQVIATNPGTVPVANAALQVAFGPRFSVVSASPGATTGTAGLSWALGTLSPNARRTFTVRLQLAANAPLNDTLAVSATLQPLPGDLTPANNVETVRLISTNGLAAYRVSVSHPTLTVGQVQAATPLEYTIQFQNTGTDTAFTVVVRDTLPAQLRGSSVRVIGASAPYTLQVRAGGVVEVVCSGRPVPPRRTDAPGSQGFVRLSITPLLTLTPGTIVNNRAAIYLNSTTAHLTPFARTRIVGPMGLDAPAANPLAASVWPNPAHGTVQVSAAAPAGGAIEFALLDLLGRPVRTVTRPATPDGAAGHTFELGGLAPGLYFVQAVAGPHRWMQRVVVQ